MSDLTAEVSAPAEAEAPAESVEATVTEAPAEAAGGEEPPSAATGFAVEPSLDADLPEGVDRFDRGYVEKIRGEAAKYRTEYAPFRDAFDGYEAEDRDAILSLARELQENPENAARRMLEASRSIAGDKFDDWLSGNDQPEYLTPDAVENLLAEREAKAAAQREVEAINKEAADLGYTEGTPEHVQLFWLAANQTNGSIQDAHAAIQANKQAIIDAYVAEVRAKGEKFPATPTQVTGSPSNQGENNTPRSIAEASERFRARLEALDGV